MSSPVSGPGPDSVRPALATVASGESGDRTALPDAKTDRSVMGLTGYFVHSPGVLQIVR